MPVTKPRTDARSKSSVHKDDETARREQAELLLNEIDNLAVLLHEVRKQTDRIEAAADAIGDAVLSHINGAIMQEVEPHNSKKTVSILQMRSRARLRNTSAVIA